MLQKLLTVLMVFSGIISLAQSGNSTTANTADYTAIGSPMPSFMAVTLDTLKRTPGKASTKVLKDKDVKNNANLFVMIFNPICEHCEDQTMMIEKNIGLFKQSNIVLICGKTFRQYLNNFLLITHNKEYPTIKIGVDSTDFIKKTLTYDLLPQLNIYNHDRKLIKTFSGATPLDSFKQYIE